MTSHGILDKRIAETYQLGLVAEPLPNDERFSGCLVIPYLSRHGVKAIKFRNIDGKPKYAQHAGQTARLYNTAAYFADGDTIGIAEGEIDAIVATERLGIPTIGIPGAEMWTANREIWTPVFRNFQTVYIWRDGDDAGKNLADAVTGSLKWRARVIDAPDGEDVSSMVANGRKDELLKRIPRAGDDDAE